MPSDSGGVEVFSVGGSSRLLEEARTPTLRSSGELRRIESLWLPFRQIKPRCSVRLFCFPHAGGSATLFHGWQDRIPDEVEICAVQLPGHGTRLTEPLLLDVIAIAHEFVEALLSLLKEPFALFGHSMGALLAYEVARLLQARYGMNPEIMIVSGSRAPHLKKSGPPTYRLSPSALIDHLRTINGTPAELFNNQEVITLLLPVIRADFQAVQTYEHIAEPPLACPIVAIGGVDDPGITFQDLSAWRLHTNNSFLTRMFPGDHFFINESATEVLFHLRMVVLTMLNQNLHVRGSSL